MAWYRQGFLAGGVDEHRGERGRLDRQQVGRTAPALLQRRQVGSNGCRTTDEDLVDQPGDILRLERGIEGPFVTGHNGHRTHDRGEARRDETGGQPHRERAAMPTQRRDPDGGETDHADRDRGRAQPHRWGALTEQPPCGLVHPWDVVSVMLAFAANLRRRTTGWCGAACQPVERPRPRTKAVLARCRIVVFAVKAPRKRGARPRP